MSRPLGGLCPKFGVVTILSMFGFSMLPKTVSVCFVYCGSLNSFVHSSMLSCPSFTWYRRFGFLFFSSLQLFSIDLIVLNSSCGGYIVARASLLYYEDCF